MSDDREAAEVSAFGYRQELRRTLRPFSLFSVSFSVISITAGIFVNFGPSFVELGPAMIWTWPVVALGQFLVVLVMAELASCIPLAGASYQWAARLVGPTYGWFVGALGIMFGSVGLPGVLLLGAAPLSEYILGTSASPRLTLCIALLWLTLAYIVNIISVRAAAGVNNAAVFIEILASVVLGVVLLVLWAVGTKDSDHGLGYLTHSIHPANHPLWYAVIVASLLAISTFVGFESAAAVAEEAVDAGRSVPRAMIRSVVAAAALGLVALIGFVLAVPDEQTVALGGLPGVFEYWLGSGLSRLAVSGVVVAMGALAIIGAAAHSRLLYAMARDDLLPAASRLRSVNPTTRTPVVALVVSYLSCVGVLVYGYASTDAFPTLVGATALVPFLVYALTLVGYGFRWRRLVRLPGGFHLGRMAIPILCASLAWVSVVLLILTLPDRFRDADYYAAGGLVLAALWWLAALKPRLAQRRSPPPAHSHSSTG